jgi:drug/metabolite transporter (DMT)-like permease
MDESHARPITPISAFLALLCSALWGANAVAAQFTQDDLPPLGTAGLRFALSVPFLILWFRIEKTRLWPNRAEIAALAIVGLFVFGQIGTFHLGLSKTNSAHASLIIGMNPVLVALLAHFLLPGEKLNLAIVSGLVLAAAGLSLVVFGRPDSGQDAVTLAGDLILAGSCLLLSLKLIYSKHVLQKVDPGRLLVWSHLVGAALLLGASGLFEGYETYRFTSRALAGLAFMGIIVAVFCFGTWTILLRRHPAGQLQVFGFAQPVFGVFFGVWLRGDPLTTELMLGAAGIGLGIFLVTRFGRHKV